MNRPGQRPKKPWKLATNTAFWALTAVSCLLAGCNQRAADQAAQLSDAAHPAESTSAAPSASAPAVMPAVSLGPYPYAPPRTAVLSGTPGGVEKVDYEDVAMGTNVHFIAYTNAQVDTQKIRVVMTRALAEMKRLEGLLSEWRDDSEVGKINLNPEQWVSVGPETYAVIARGLQEGKESHGAFDITFQAMSGLWKFGSAADAEPKVPTKAEIEQRRKLVDYRSVELDEKAHAVRIPKDHKLGLGGIAKGYIVDRAADLFKQAGIQAFLVQAGGDLYGAGRKPDGSAWISGIQDPRQVDGVFFATIELTDHAFSTAGDYARAYVVGKRRYHHIIDPHTGYPATASRSVTVWAEDATTADAIDDAVFIMGPEQGMKLAEATPGVGVVIVDKNNKVWISPRLKDKIHVTRQPTDGL